MPQPISTKIPTIDEGFGDSFAGTNIVVSFFYDIRSFMLYVCLKDVQFNVFINVPQSIAKAFNYSKDPDSFYLNSIFNYYKVCLLTENCVILAQENGNYLIC